MKRTNIFGFLLLLVFSYTYILAIQFVLDCSLSESGFSGKKRNLDVYCILEFNR